VSAVFLDGIIAKLNARHAEATARFYVPLQSGCLTCPQRERLDGLGTQTR
jgi:hypothetical protein